MSTWSNLYFESNSSAFPDETWSLVFCLPWYIGSEYLDFFGWENPSFLRKYGQKTINSPEFQRIPSDLSKPVQEKAKGIYCFVLDIEDFLEGAIALLDYWDKSQNNEMKSRDKKFIEVAINLVKIFQEESLSLRVIHIVS